ncbi:urease accessory protein [Corynebacterium sp. CNJ-954]|uniref:urease accessory protein UreD n=1 Tax=Corynebacterium sp. CNJ-954 TaxID=1904962 RepID=UPI0009612877|nr:urease accessory protein UreD [Corynebacterium sp. CNJ-954]OLT51897.1 urease accessory protein [Corynebacterium sp. CNJ-954]
MTSLDPSSLTPPVPHEMADVAGERSSGGVMPVGRPGKVGVLDVTLGVRGGRTGVVSRFVKAPMQLTRPLYIDPSDPGEAFLYIRTTGGGLAQNDRIRQVLRLESGSRATVTTQAGTPVHRMDAGMASQWVSLHVADGAVCEYLPGQTILFAGSRLLQTTDVDVAPGGTVLAAEVMLTGRLARGEVNGFDTLAQRFRVTRNGRPLLSDTLCVTGATANSEMLLSRWPVWGTVLIVPSAGSAGTSVKKLLVSVRELLVEQCAGTDAGDLTAAASTMVGDAGLTVRVAGEDPVAVRAVVDAVHDHARRALLGRPAVDLRRM